MQRAHTSRDSNIKFLGPVAQNRGVGGQQNPDKKNLDIFSWDNFYLDIFFADIFYFFFGFFFWLFFGGAFFGYIFLEKMDIFWIFWHKKKLALAARKKNIDIIPLFLFHLDFCEFF